VTATKRHKLRRFRLKRATVSPDLPRYESIYIGMRKVHAMKIRFLILAALLALGGCVCRPGHIGPYGGVHPGACYVQNTADAFV
jgi:hypothetical protein